MPAIDVHGRPFANDNDGYTQGQHGISRGVEVTCPGESKPIKRDKLARIAAGANASTTPMAHAIAKSGAVDLAIMYDRSNCMYLFLVCFSIVVH